MDTTAWDVSTTSLIRGITDAGDWGKKDLNTSDLLFLNSFAHFHFQRLSARLGEPLILAFLMFVLVILLPGEVFPHLTSSQIRTAVIAAEVLSKRLDFWEHGGRYEHRNVVNPMCAVP